MAFTGIGAHKDVLHDREFREHLAAFGDIADAQAHDLLGVHAVDAFAHELDGALFRLVVV
jgi:hypothetical protein